MPKLQADVLLNFEKNVDFYHSYYFLAGAEGTNKYIAPKIGVTFSGCWILPEVMLSYWRYRNKR
jgi:hypothetical protein